MQVTINKKEFDVPFDLSLITVEQFMEYQRKYGDDVDSRYKLWKEKEYEGDADEVELLKTLDLEEIVDYEALCWFSYWTKHNLHEARDVPGIAPLLSQYRILNVNIRNQLSEVKEVFPKEYEWKDGVWTIDTYLVTPASNMTFNEIITAKETLRQLAAIGKGRWESLIYLCAIFLRQKDEAFTDEMIYEGGTRMELMKELPMNIALNVSFFLTGCVNIWQKISASSLREAEGLELRN